MPRAAAFAASLPEGSRNDRESRRAVPLRRRPFVPVPDLARGPRLAAPGRLRPGLLPALLTGLLPALRRLLPVLLLVLPLLLPARAWPRTTAAATAAPPRMTSAIPQYPHGAPGTSAPPPGGATDAAGHRASGADAHRDPGAAHRDAAAGATALPPGPAYTLPPEKLRRAEALNRDEDWLWAAGTVWSVASLLLVLRLGWAAALGRAAARLSRRRSVQGLVFLPLLAVLLHLLDLPLALAAHHLGLLYGLSVERWPAWLLDWAKGLLLSAALVTLTGSLLFAIVRRSPARWWLWFWLLSLPLMLAGAYAEPLLVDPLFHRFEPLARTEPALTARVEALVRRAGVAIPPGHMFLMRASEKTTEMNAYVTGFGASKRVVVWDTALRHSSGDEILFIFAHELGHYVLGDVAHGLMMAAAGLFAGLWITRRAALCLVRRFGERWQIASLEDWSAAVVLLLVATALGILSEPVGNAFSRRIEHRADVYGQEAIHGLVADPRAVAVHSFQVLGEQSLEIPDPNPWMVFWTYSHPPIAARAEFARRYDPWAPGGHPRFFQR